MTFLLLGIGYLSPNKAGAPSPPLIKAGGVFGILAAFMAWYNALAGILDDSNRLASGFLFRSIAANHIFQFLHHPSSPFPLVRNGVGEARQAGEQSHCLSTISTEIIQITSMSPYKAASNVIPDKYSSHLMLENAERLTVELPPRLMDYLVSSNPVVPLHSKSIRN